MPRNSVDKVIRLQVGDYRNAHTVWANVAFRDGTTGWLPTNSVPNKLIAQHVARRPSEARRLIGSLVRRQRDTPIQGQYGAVANLDLAAGTVFAFPKGSYSMGDRTTSRSLDIERNTFKHPIAGRPDFAVDTGKNSTLRSINSAWNGRPQGAGGRVLKSQVNVSLGVFPQEGVVLCYVHKKIAVGHELRLSYKWYFDDIYYE